MYVQHIMSFSRWLLARNKHDEVEKIFYKMVRMNGLQVTDEALNKFKELSVTKDETVYHLFIFFLAHYTNYDIEKVSSINLLTSSKHQHAIRTTFSHTERIVLLK